MGNWRENIAQNLVANAIWALLLLVFGVLVVVLAKATTIIRLFAPFSYLVCLLLAGLLLAAMAYLGAAAWRHLYPVTVPAPVGSGEPPPPEQELTLKEQAVLALDNALDDAQISLQLRTDEQHERSFHLVEAAMLSVSKQFGIKMLKVPLDDEDYTQALQAYVYYIQRFLPMLQQGHYEAAKAKAADFRRENGV